MGMKLKGLVNFDNAIARNVKKVSTTREQALQETGQRGVRVFKDNTPVDEGRLRNATSYTTKGRVYGRPDNMEDQINPLYKNDTVAIGNNTVYAEWVEYMAKNGSQGYFLRSWRQFKPIALRILKGHFRNLG